MPKLKYKRYATAYIQYDGKADKPNECFFEDWWPVEHFTLKEAKACLGEDIENIDDVSMDFNGKPGFVYDEEAKTMTFLEIWSVRCRRDRYDGDEHVSIEDSDSIKCHYISVPANCPEFLRKIIKEEMNCPVVRYKA